MKKRIITNNEWNEKLKEANEYLEQTIRELEILLEHPKPSKSVKAKSNKNTLPKKLIGKVQETPSPKVSRSFLTEIIKNDGTITNRDGTHREFDLTEARHLLWDKEERNAERLWKEHHAANF